MANGMLGQLPPGLRGMLAAEQMAQQRSGNQLNQLGGILSLRAQMEQQRLAQEEAPLRRQLLEAQVGRATAPPAPKWQVSERFNEQTGKKEKVLVDLNNPANVIPFGGQEARNLSFQNTGKTIVGLDPTTGQPIGTPLGVTASPHQEWQQNTQFPWSQQVDRARLSNEAAGLNMRGAELGYNTGIMGMGAGAGAPPLGPVAPGPRMPMPQPGPQIPRPAPALGVAPPRNAGPVAPQQIVGPGAALPQPAPGPQLPPRLAAEQAAKKAEKNAELEKTVATYVAARDGLMSGLSGTYTNPVAGAIPALTAAQQVGEGGVAAIAPVLKQIFRSAGEGIFSDKDQELLLRMVPTRSDHPEARKAKLDNIDNIISAKLGIQVPPMGGGQQQRRATDNAQGWSIRPVQ